MMSPSYLYKATIVKIIDGDTVDAVIQAGFYITLTLRLRLVRINAPEITSKDETEKQKGMAAKDFVTSQILNSQVIIQTQKSDLFGRWLADIWYIKDGKEINLSDQLLALGHAVVYKH